MELRLRRLSSTQAGRQRASTGQWVFADLDFVCGASDTHCGRCVSFAGSRRQDTPVERVQTPETSCWCRCGTRQGVRCLHRLVTATGEMAHEVPATDVGGTHGLNLCATTMTASSARVMCQTLFCPLANGKTPCGCGVANGTVLCGPICQSRRVDRTTTHVKPLRVPQSLLSLHLCLPDRSAHSHWAPTFCALVHRITRLFDPIDVHVKCAYRLSKKLVSLPSAREHHGIFSAAAPLQAGYLGRHGEERLEKDGRGRSVAPAACTSANSPGVFWRRSSNKGPRQSWTFCTAFFGRGHGEVDGVVARSTDAASAALGSSHILVFTAMLEGIE